MTKIKCELCENEYESIDPEKVVSIPCAMPICPICGLPDGESPLEWVKLHIEFWDSIPNTKEIDAVIQLLSMLKKRSRE